MRDWITIKEFEEIKFEYFEGVAKITINRPRYRNAFTPDTVKEMIESMTYCRECQDISTIILTGEGDKAFCSGGDQHNKNIAGYIGKDGIPRLNVLDLQKMIRSIPKPVAVMLSVADTFYMWYVIYRLLPKMLFLDKPVHEWEVSMPVLVLLIWHVWLDRKKPVKYGFFVNNILLPRL